MRLGNFRTDVGGWVSLSVAMRARGIDDRVLASKIGVEPRTIGAYRRCEIMPPLQNIVAMAEALGVTEEFLRENGPVPPVYTGCI